jgi:cobalt-zinc-cadmium efflux system membrane fusion protein
MTLFRAVAVAAAALAIAACGRTRAASDPPATETTASAPAASPRGTIVLDDAQLQSIRVESIAERDLPRSLTAAGKVQFDEDRVARILAPVPGQVVGVRVKVGDPVRKGQAVCAISSREAAAAVAEHTESHKDLDLAQKTLAMTEDLFGHQAASKIALQQAQNDYAKAASRVRRSHDELRVLGLDDEDAIAAFSGRLPIVSPIGGIVIERHVTDGQFVQTDSTPLMTIADLSTVWVLGDIFERDLRFVSVGATAQVATAAYPDERFTGRVDYVSAAIDPATRSAKVRLSVPNPAGRLKPEMFASLTLRLADVEHVLTVPARAVFVQDGRAFVYTLVDRGRFVRRAVDLGADEGSDRRIVGGLRAGDRIVVDGALLLEEEEKKRAGDG